MGRHDSITTLEKLISRLDGCEKRSNCYNDIMRFVNIRTEELQKFCYFSGHHYTRNLVFRTLDYELVTKCWEAGQGNEIHDHNGQESWMIVLQGELTENRYTLATLHGRIQPVGSARLPTGSISYIHDNIGLHRISNQGLERAISFHLYVLPVEAYNIYQEITGQPERVNTRYDSHGGVVIG